jgi:hypothetical protein
VTVEDILARVDIKRRPVLLVQGTEPNILPAAGGPTLPVVLLEIVQQRQSPPECFDAFVHSAFFASGT